MRFLRRILINSVKRYSSLTEASSSTNTTHFGYETINEKEKDEKVHKVFANVATKYDLMNDVMSLGVHRCWKDILIDRLGPTGGTRLLDLAGGSGDVAERFVRATEGQEPATVVTVCDINEEMIKQGMDRDKSNTIKWVVGNAEKLPFEDTSFDAVTIAFGLRNVTRPKDALDEVYRVLTPGGRFLCLEFSKVENPLLSAVYDAYSFQVIPVMGQVLAGDFKSYQYLVESIRKFPDQETLKTMIQDAGFWSVTYENLTFGVVAIHSGFKL